MLVELIESAGFDNKVKYNAERLLRCGVKDDESNRYTVWRLGAVDDNGQAVDTAYLYDRLDANGVQAVYDENGDLSDYELRAAYTVQTPKDATVIEAVDTVVGLANDLNGANGIKKQLDTKQLRRDVVFNCIKSDYVASSTDLKLVMNPLLPELKPVAIERVGYQSPNNRFETARTRASERYGDGKRPRFMVFCAPTVGKHKVDTMLYLFDVLNFDSLSCRHGNGEDRYFYEPLESLSVPYDNPIEIKHITRDYLLRKYEADMEFAQQKTKFDRGRAEINILPFTNQKHVVSSCGTARLYLKLTNL